MVVKSEALVVVPFECDLLEWSVKPGDKIRTGMDLCAVVVGNGQIMSVDSPGDAIVSSVFPAVGDRMSPGDPLAKLEPIPLTSKPQVVKQLAEGLLFQIEEVDKGCATISRFAHGQHDFQVRYEDGRVFRVTVEEWNEGKNCPALPRD